MTLKVSAISSTYRNIAQCILSTLVFSFHRGDAQAKTGKSASTKGAYQRKLAELKKKIKQTNNDANDCDKGTNQACSIPCWPGQALTKQLLYIFLDIRGLQESQKEISVQLEEKQSKVYQLQSAVDEADLNIDKLTDERQRVSMDSSISSKLFSLEVQ